MSYISLHTHTSMGSLLDGMGLTEDYCRHASEIDMPYLGISDHGTADNFVNFQKSCKKWNIIPIFGVEFYVVPDIAIKAKGEQRNHVLAFAKNETGFQNILKMISISNIDGFFFRPRVSPEILLQHSEGLIITTGCSASPLTRGYGVELFENLIDKNPGDVYLEIMPHTHKEQYDVNQICLDFSKKYDVKMIATNDSHYVRKEDAKAHEVMLAVGTAKKWNDPARWKFNGSDFYLRSRRDMIQAFVNQNQFEREVFADAMANTMEIAIKCSDLQWIKQCEVSLPKVSTVSVDDDFQALEGLCRSAFIKMGFDNNKIYRERLDEELSLIKEKKFERYFLLVWDLINWCRNENIMVGPGRGSSSGSLVCYLLGITQIDPIKHGLLFFRFLAPDRCLVGGTKILTDAGEKKIEDLKVGDKIYNKHGQLDEVSRTKRFMVNEEIVVIGYEESEIRCTKDHKWLVLNESGQMCEKMASEINWRIDKLIRLRRDS
jgi:DNA polymerase III subunit alpha